STKAKSNCIKDSVYIDDGYTGSNFERPSFKEMMDEVRAGEINCIVVKDLSRFGRNYLDAGEYIERIFPFLGVRFIAVNDNYDSLNSNAEADSLLIPFKNLINEAYCRDISIKIRSQLEVKRKRGDFIGSFAVYGYKKDPANKNHLEIDSFAADVVRDIFRWKLEGIGGGDIADRLNEDGVPSPLEYKKSQGLCFATPFCAEGPSMWSASAVLRILKNPVYTGVLTQGKTTTPSYKVKRRVEKPPGEWAVAEGTHEAIINKEDFAVVQKILETDTRTSPGGRAVELFSGILFCGECGGPMVRKTVPAGKNKYVYYVCGNHKKEKTCFSHSISNRMLEEAALKGLQIQIQARVNTSDFLERALAALREKSGIKKLKERLEEKQGEKERYRRVLDSLYGNLAEGVIDGAEYAELKKSYAALFEEAGRQAEKIRRELRSLEAEGTAGQKWLDRFKECGNITELDRALIVFLIERIFICRDKRAEIVYGWKDG
ncbi:MAG: recombinase family protein, partial [Clostridium sp.]|nr:recombinase family protein [Clostridium sp.]